MTFGPQRALFLLGCMHCLLQAVLILIMHDRVCAPRKGPGTWRIARLLVQLQDCPCQRRGRRDTLGQEVDAAPALRGKKMRSQRGDRSIYMYIYIYSQPPIRRRSVHIYCTYAYICVIYIICPYMIHSSFWASSFGPARPWARQRSRESMGHQLLCVWALSTATLVRHFWSGKFGPAGR